MRDEAEPPKNADHPEATNHESSAFGPVARAWLARADRYRATAAETKILELRATYIDMAEACEGLAARIEYQRTHKGAGDSGGPTPAAAVHDAFGRQRDI